MTRAVTRGGIVVRLVVVVSAIWAMHAAATGIRTNNSLSLNGAVVVALLVIVGLVISAPVPQLIILGLRHLPGCRAIAAIAPVFRPHGVVRFVIVATVTVATAAAILGASVEARPDTRRAVDERLARLPVLPLNVALVRLDAKYTPALDASRPPAFSQTERNHLRAAVTRAVPGAELIALRDVGAATLSLVCDHCNDGPLVVADPRLRSIYQSDARYPPEGGVNVGLLAPAPEPLQEHTATRVPTRDALLLAVREDKPLPPASFVGAVYYEVPRAVVDALHMKTKVRSLFIRAPEPLTGVQLARLAAIARSAHTAPHTDVKLIGPSGQLVPPAARPTRVAVSASLRRAPWAATSTASRWSFAVGAGLIALMTLTLSINTSDRRRKVQRLRRLGATPPEVRGAAALQAAVLFIVVTWLSALLVIWLVHAGTGTFNRAEPTIPVPFTIPWPVVLTLAIGLPILAAALSALVASGPAREGADPTTSK